MEMTKTLSYGTPAGPLELELPEKELKEMEAKPLGLVLDKEILERIILQNLSEETAKELKEGTMEWNPEGLPKAEKWSLERLEKELMNRIEEDGVVDANPEVVEADEEEEEEPESSQESPNPEKRMERESLRRARREPTFLYLAERILNGSLA